MSGQNIKKLKEPLSKKREILRKKKKEGMKRRLGEGHVVGAEREQNRREARDRWGPYGKGKWRK